MVLVGTSHHEISLETLDALSQGAEQLLSRVSAPDYVNGAVVLATCNRLEVYLDAGLFHDAIDHTTAVLAEASGFTQERVAELMRVSVGASIAEHLFAVAAGLESMVVGETEVSGQVGRALAEARDVAATTPALERLFQQAARTAKQVVSSTGLGAAGRSLVGVGLDLVRDRHGGLHGQRALVIGTGAYARIAIAALRDRGCAEIFSFSGTGRAQQFASSHQLIALDDSDVEKCLQDVDLVVSCSGVHDYVLGPAYRDVVAGRSRVLPAIDLALHSDISPPVREVLDYINLDVIAASAPAEHADTVEAARRVVREAVAIYGDGEAGRSADPAVIALRSHVDSVVDEEVERVRRRSGDDAADVVAASLRRVTGALLHTPTMRARDMAKTGDGIDYARAVHTLFGISVALDDTAHPHEQEK